MMESQNRLYRTLHSFLQGPALWTLDCDSILEVTGAFPASAKHRRHLNVI